MRVIRPRPRPRPPVKVAPSAPKPTPPEYAVVLISAEYTDYARRGVLDRLPGCHADAAAFTTLLTQRLGIPSNCIYILSDDGKPSNRGTPSKASILVSFQWMLSQCALGTRKLILYYSGHGTQVADAVGAASDEADGRDEAIVPSDFISAGMITDDVIFSNLTSRLPADAKLTAFFDSCNSGTVMDLNYMMNSTDSVTTIASRPSAVTSREIRADVISISGCRDSQTSASAYGIGADSPGWRGAMTYCLEKALASNGYRNATCDALITQLRRELSTRGFTQVPEICFSVAGAGVRNKKVFW